MKVASNCVLIGSGIYTKSRGNDSILLGAKVLFYFLAKMSQIVLKFRHAYQKSNYLLVPSSRPIVEKRMGGRDLNNVFYCN